MLFKRRPREEEQSAPPLPQKEEPPAGAAVLRDELGLNPLWYLELRLKEELSRAARGAVTFSIAAWEPRLLSGDKIPPEILARVAGFIAGKLRTYDVAARSEGNRFIALLVDADAHHANTVAYRIKADIQVQIPGASKWRAGVATYGRDGVDIDGLIQVTLRRLDEDAASAAA